MRGSVQLSQLLQCLPQGGGTALRSSERGGASVPSSTACTVVHSIVHICSTSTQHLTSTDRPSSREGSIDHRSTKKQTHIDTLPEGKVTGSSLASGEVLMLLSCETDFRLSPVQGEPHSSVHSSLPRARSRPSLSSRRVSTSPRHHGARTHICIFFFFLCGQGRSTSAPAGLLSSISP